MNESEMVESEGESLLIEWLNVGEISPAKIHNSWYIHNLFEVGQISILAGPAASGLSFMAMDMAYAIAAGHEWFGRKTMKSNVVFLSSNILRGVPIRLRLLRAVKPSVFENVDDMIVCQVQEAVTPENFQDWARKFSKFLLSRTGENGSFFLVVDDADLLFSQLDGGQLNELIDLVRNGLNCHILLVTKQYNLPSPHVISRASVILNIVRPPAPDFPSLLTTSKGRSNQFVHEKFKLDPVKMQRSDFSPECTSCIVVRVGS